ncbi:hypothetical protein C3L33_22431, partial [Rhododendron williamsianum]
MVRFKPNHLYTRRLSTSSTSNSTPYLNSHFTFFLSNQIPDPKSLLQTHAFIITTGHTNNPFIASKLISLYASLNKPTFSSKVFHSVQSKDAFLWNTVIKSQFSNGCYSKALDFYLQMRMSYILPTHFTIPLVVASNAELLLLKRGMEIHGVGGDGERPNSRTLEGGFQACGNLGALLEGKCLHGLAVKTGVVFTNVVQSSVLSMTGIKVLRTVYRNATSRSVTSLLLIKSLMHENVSIANSLIDIHSGRSTDALGLFDKMVSEGFKPNVATLVTILSACSHIASLEKGEQIHSYAKDEGFELDISLSTALVDMYAKCGQLDKSRKIFDAIKEKDAISWNVMISGYGMHGDAESAIEIFQQMKQSNVRPNELTFLAVLSACTHAGLVREGKCFFDRMGNYALSPNLKHYSCMVDLLGRSGNLHEAEDLVLSMPIAPMGVFGVLC